MPSTTAINALRYAVQSDAPSGQAALQNLAEDLDTRLVPRFASGAARDAAIPAPVYGQMCSVASTGIMWYNGAAWTIVGRTVLFATKTADESVTSSATPQNDDHLSLTMTANTSYLGQLRILYSAPTAADLKIALSTSATGALHRMYIGAPITVSSFPTTVDFVGASNITSAFSSSQDVVGGTGNSNSAYFEDFLFVVSGTGGALTVQWAQGTSNASATTVLKGSWMRLEQVS